MILYFTGTGNSEYVAKRIAEGTKQTTLNLFQKIRDNDRSALHSDEPWIIVCPTYAWRIPRVLEQWLKGTKLSGNKRIYFVMTCGGSIGNAGKYLKLLCHEKGLNYSGCYEVVMPENYIALFETPSQSESLSIIENAQIEINKAIQIINDSLNFPEPQISLNDRISSGIVNHIFYPVCVHAKKFHVTEKCISCGICEKVCPLNNVKIVNGSPNWSNNCTHCMACICRCPKEAIEYGSHSVGLPRYVCLK